MGGEGFAIVIWTIGAIAIGLLLALLAILLGSKKGYRGPRIRG